MFWSYENSEKLGVCYWKYKEIRGQVPKHIWPLLPYWPSACPLSLSLWSYANVGVRSKPRRSRLYIYVQTLLTPHTHAYVYTESGFVRLQKNPFINCMVIVGDRKFLYCKSHMFFFFNPKSTTWYGLMIFLSLPLSLCHSSQFRSCS